MSWEEWLERQEGLDPAKIKVILDNIAHFATVVETEIPRLKQLAGDIRAQIAAYEAKQKEYNRG